MGTAKKKKVEKFFHYGQLDLRKQAWVDGYLEQHPEMDRSNRSFHRVRISKFLLHLEEKGVVFPEGLTHDDVLSYVRERGDGSCLGDFLRHVEGICQSGRHFLGECAVQRYARNIIGPEDMKKWDKSAESSSVEEFMRASGEVSAWMDACAYSTESKSEFRRAVSQMGIFLERNGLRFSRPLAYAWIEAIARRNDMAEHPYRWVLEVASRLESGDGSRKRRKESRRRALPEWSIPLLEEYLSARRQDGMAKSTVRMDRCCLARFIRHLEKSGCRSFTEMTPAMVVGFHLGDTLHKTPEAKNAYNTRVRMFLRFLSVKKVVPYSLPEALPRTSSIQQRPVRTLSMEEREALERSFESPPKRGRRTHLRNIAILKLELYMGLRHSDATGLRFDDVDANGMKISLVQAKTGRRMEIPLPATVLNSILRYVRDERPSLESPYIFLTSKVPYKPLTIPALDSNLRDITGGYGHHILRKTFATDLLQGGNGVPMIADLLGHSDDCNVHKYLGTNSETMRRCSIPLDGVGYSGGLL